MKEGFTLVQEAFNSESFIGNQNTLFSQKHKLEESRKDRPSLFRIGENIGGKEKKKRIKPGEWKRKSKTQMEFLNLEAQKDENSKEGSERDQKQEKPRTPS